MHLYIDKLISEWDIKWLLYERAKINKVIEDTKNLLQETLLRKDKLEKQITSDEELVVYINNNI